MSSPDKVETVVIVGHGPSMTGSKLGDKIDSHRYIVRMLLPSEVLRGLAVEDFGSKTDVLMYSRSNKKYLQREIRIPRYGYWHYDKYSVSMVQERSVIHRGNLVDVGCPGAMAGWLNKLRTIGRVSDGFKEHYPKMKDMRPHFFRGFAAIILAGELVRPKTVLLAGFDSLWERSSSGRIFAVIGPTEGFFARHDPEAERKLLPEIEAHYGMEVLPLC